MNKAGERLYNGLVKENPTFVLMLGMCPTLAVTTSAINGLGMGLTTAVVLALSNMIISLLRKVIPSRVRIPAFIVIIASFVTVLQLLLEAYLPELNEALGVYIPLIVVNCIILGRAEAYAYFNPPVPSLFDGIGMGLGFSVALTAIGLVRELLGSGKVFGIDLGLPMEPIGIFVLAPGAFFVLAALTALQNFIKIRGEKKGKDMSKIQSGCGGDCLNCGEENCEKRFYDTTVKNRPEEDEDGVDFESLDVEDTEEEPAAKETPEAPWKEPETAEETVKDREAEQENTLTEAENPKEAEAGSEGAAETVENTEDKAETVDLKEAEEVKAEEEKTAKKKRTSKKSTGKKPAEKETKSRKKETLKAEDSEKAKVSENVEVLDLDEEEDEA